MQFLMLIKIANNADYEAGKPPPPELEAAMGQLMGEWSKASAMVSAAGLRPTSQAARVRLTAGEVRVSDGPFTEAKEVVGGYSVLDVRSHEEAVEGARRMMQIHLDHWPGWEGSCEVRRISGPEEGPPTS